MNIKIVQYPTKTYNGIRAYSNNLYNDIIAYEKANNLCDNINLKNLPKIELNFKGKLIGGYISSDLLSFTVGKGDIIHSTSQSAMTSHTNVVTIHDLIHLLYSDKFHTPSNIVKRQLKQLERIKESAKHIIVLSPHVEKQVKKYISNIPISTIVSKIFVDRPTKNPFPNDGKIHLITIGEIYEGSRKQINELYLWLRDNSEIDLYHIGKIADKAYINYAKNIHALGSVSQQEKYNYLAYADKFVFKTFGEGQGMPTMEAMKLNTQVIVNDIEDHRILLGNKPYYYSTKDEFFEAIYKPKKQGLVEQISQYDNWIEKYLKVYKQVID